MDNKQKEEIREEFIFKCFNSDGNDCLNITGVEAQAVADWWLSKIDTLLISQRDSLVEKIEEIKGVYDIEIRGGTEMIEKQEVITLIKQNK